MRCVPATFDEGNIKRWTHRTSQRRPSLHGFPLSASLEGGWTLCLKTETLIPARWKSARIVKDWLLKDTSRSIEESLLFRIIFFRNKNLTKKSKLLKSSRFHVQTPKDLHRPLISLLVLLCKRQYKESNMKGEERKETCLIGIKVKMQNVFIKHEKRKLKE
jgi:hypothetical protein